MLLTSRGSIQLSSQVCAHRGSIRQAAVTAGIIALRREPRLRYNVYDAEAAKRLRETAKVRGKPEPVQNYSRHRYQLDPVPFRIWRRSKAVLNVARRLGLSPSAKATPNRYTLLGPRRPARNDPVKVLQDALSPTAPKQSDFRDDRTRNDYRGQTSGSWTGHSSRLERLRRSSASRRPGHTPSGIPCACCAMRFSLRAIFTQPDRNSPRAPPVRVGGCAKS